MFIVTIQYPEKSIGFRENPVPKYVLFNIFCVHRFERTAVTE